ncbi:MAG: class I SAM-dependent methyltransferase [Candidatus Uhrbacteria bacterium]|nr:class I SAM-dependent methyltransferase [Candidatus Uhrbacteria bacterium]MDP3793945.1 class I SAM-dependent methyltransferase [Candidatus Uhrbacteria bacterium]
MNLSDTQPRVTRFFNDFAPTYFSRYEMRNQDGHSFRIRKQRVLEGLHDLPSGATVLDVGCGPGVMIRELLARDFRVIATDIAPAMIEECRRRFGDEPRLTLAVTSAEQLPVADSSVDAVIAMGLVEYLPDDEAVLREFARVLKPNGRLIVTLPHEACPSRLWDRLTKFLARPIVLAVRRARGKTIPQVIHREYRVNTYRQLCEAAGLNVTNVIFYNMKFFLRPLDRLFPSLGVWCSERLERFGRTPMIRRLGTGFIVFGRKHSPNQ